MAASPLDPLGSHSATPAELKQRIQADRAGRPYLLYRDTDARQVLHSISDDQQRLVVGRDASCDVPLHWDPAVSGVHAILERVGRNWLLIDNGLSTHGTLVNGRPIHGRRRLRPDDRILVGDTMLVFRIPEPPRLPSTASPTMMSEAPRLSDRQRDVLVALCRPYGADPARLPTTATNEEIAAELNVGKVAVKTHLRALFKLFAVEDLPQTRKRTRLMERAFAVGAVSFDDYRT